MASLSFLVGITGNIISVLLFLSPVGTFLHILKHRSTEEFESLPYICTLLSSSLWTYYGIIKPGETLVATVNGFGVAVEIIYITLFLVFAPPKIREMTATLVGLLNVGFVAVAILTTRIFIDRNLQIDIIGLLGAGLNIVMYGSPFAAIKTVVTTKSVEYMPFLLSFFTFLNGGVWTVYAVLKKDWFLGVSNGVGLVLGGAQIIVYAIYWRRNLSKTKNANSQNYLEQGLLQPTTPVGENNEA